MEEDRDMRIVVRGGVYEVDLAEWKCHSIYWPGEAFDLQRGTWFQEITWQPLQCEYADRIEQEHLNHFRGHKMADYVWDSATQSRLERQVRYKCFFREINFTKFFVKLLGLYLNGKCDLFSYLCIIDFPYFKINFYMRTFEMISIKKS